jgi:predicted dehydrogenase
MATYAAAVVGTGNMGARHGEAYAALENCDLVACADLDVDRARAFADDLGVDRARVYRDYAAMLAAEDLDVVSVVTPIPTHAAVVLDCLDLGDLRAIHCEKPMADTWAECCLMAQEARRRGVQLTFDHQLRFSGPVERAGDLLAEGAIGDLVRVEAARGDLFEAGIHQVDLCSHFAGDVPGAWVLGQLDYREREVRNGVHIEGQALGQWRYENGVYGLVSTGVGADAVGCHNRLVGTNGVVEIAFWEEDSLRVRRDGEGWEAVDCEFGTPIRDGLADALDALETGADPLLSARRALVGTELVYGIWESARRRGRVDLPLEIEDNPLRAMLESGALSPE